MAGFTKFLSCFVLLYVLILNCSVRAQVINPVRLNGIVRENSTALPLQFATIKLLATDTSRQLVRSALSNEKGVFSLVIDQPGNYILLVSHSGYEDLQSIVSADSLLSAAPVIYQLVKKTNVLGEVIMRSKKQLVEEKDDRIIFNVSGDSSLAGAYGIEALRKTPFVIMDGSGSVMVNGKPAKILLNGKATGIITSNPVEALKVYPADLIKRIEVITNPSSRYQAEGISSIINIVSKRIQGYIGGLGMHFRALDGNRGFSMSPSGSVKIGKFGLDFYGGISYDRRPYLSVSTFKTAAQGSLYKNRNTTSSGRTTDKVQWGSMELSWDLDSLHTVSGYGNLFGNGSEPEINATSTLYDGNGTLVNTILFESKKLIDNPHGDAGLDFIKKFRSHPDKEFSITTNWKWGNNRNNAESNQYSSFGNRFLVNENYFKNQQLTLQADFSVPLSSSRLIEMGANTIFRKSFSDFRSQIFDFSSNSFQPDPLNTDLFTYRQVVTGAYMNYRFKINNWMMSGGLRAEQTDLTGDFIYTRTKVAQHYFNVFPSVSISRNFKKGLSTRFSYSRRIARPGINYLNPFIDNYDSLNISFGNPKLGPEFNNNYEARISLNRSRYTLSASAYYFFSNKQINSLTGFNETSGVSATSFENSGRSQKIGLNAFTRYNAGKFSLWLNLNAFYTSVTYFAGSATILNDGWAFSGSLNSNYKISKTFTIRYSSWLESANIHPQGITNAYYYYNFAMEKNIFQKKIQLAFQFNRPFNKVYKKAKVTRDNKTGFETKSIDYLYYRNMQFSLIYRFGKLRENINRKKGVNADDLKN